MSGAELGLAVIGTVDLCFKYGKQLLEKYESYKAAEKEVSERAVILAARWKRISLQLEILKQIWSTLDHDHQSLQDQILQILHQKLEVAVSQISKIQTKYDRVSSIPRLTRWKYAFMVKGCLDTAIGELQTWQAIFDPTWYLIIRVNNPEIDTQLEKQTSQTTAVSVASRLRQSLTEETLSNEHIFLPADGISKFVVSEIPFSVMKTLVKVGSDTLILDHAECDPEANMTVLTRDVRTLARRLRNTDPVNFSLLKCFGVVKNQSERTGRTKSFDFIFRIPKSMRNPRSLRDHLCSDKRYSLSEVFTMAMQLAISVNYVHTMGFVHKSIRPETILIFDNGISQLGSLALVGFRSVRMADGKTLRHGDLAWDQNLYRHPDRQGLLPEADYTMQHDIYSLGVCMLEIGLWRSFVTYDQSGVPWPAEIRHKTDVESSNSKTNLVALATNELPQRMGDKFARIVINCLTCMDQTNYDFGDSQDFEDEDGVLIGVKYIEKSMD
ncbi:uncharacterized protein N7511_008642 [Penicillium nucicola]|uniref:uncharacterized protein n=1 Tax=Penicillium nucicola TaxID=1850975 RepID=UPI0025454558|nr:uncharacterized protein N7511_008642 [Penicillium nucicola]KAJ5746946.1 hypothetical protein N7511_008642 [Penicillium nucicola]